MAQPKRLKQRNVGWHVYWASTVHSRKHRTTPCLPPPKAHSHVNWQTGPSACVQGSPCTEPPLRTGRMRLAQRSREQEGLIYRVHCEPPLRTGRMRRAQRGYGSRRGWSTGCAAHVLWASISGRTVAWSPRDPAASPGIFWFFSGPPWGAGTPRCPPRSWKLGRKPQARRPRRSAGRPGTRVCLPTGDFGCRRQRPCTRPLTGHRRRAASHTGSAPHLRGEDRGAAWAAVGRSPPPAWPPPSVLNLLALHALLPLLGILLTFSFWLTHTCPSRNHLATPPLLSRLKGGVFPVGSHQIPSYASFYYSRNIYIYICVCVYMYIFYNLYFYLLSLMTLLYFLTVSVACSRGGAQRSVWSKRMNVFDVAQT